MSVGLSVERLNTMCDRSGARLGKCVYEVDAQRELLSDLVEKLWETASQQPFNGSYYAQFPTPTSIFDQYASDIFQVLALIKHSSFKEEREWRLISPLHSDLDNCEVRIGKSMFVPYLPISFGQQKPVFSNVVLGPTPHRELSMASLSAYLRRKQLSNSLIHCDIPYREW